MLCKIAKKEWFFRLNFSNFKFDVGSPQIEGRLAVFRRKFFIKDEKCTTNNFDQ